MDTPVRDPSDPAKILYQSGTEQEVEEALKADREVLVYFRRGQPPAPEDDDKLDEFPEEKIQWDPRPAVCVVMASQGYPGSYSKGKVITGLEEAAKLKDVKVFHAGTKVENNVVVTDGGRRLGITALGDTLVRAKELAYAAVERIHFQGAAYRRDIADRALRRIAEAEAATRETKEDLPVSGP